MPVHANLSVIAAVADNGVIGRANRLPWRLPADLAHFKRITMGKPMLMGRRTFESLPGLLPGRTHVVITRNRKYAARGGCVAHSLEEAIRTYGDVDELMLIGGADLYAQALPLAGRLYLTLVHTDAQGDALFPAFDRDDWREAQRDAHKADTKNPFDYTFITLVRS